MNDKKILSEEDIIAVRTMIGEKAGKLLELFYESNLLCWLDSGSLLGIIRSNKLNDWEKDIDLGIFYNDFDRALKISREFSKKENVKFRLKFLRGVPYKLSFKDKTTGSKQLPFDIHIFFKMGETAWSAQSTTLLKSGTNLPDAMFTKYSESHKHKSFLFIRFALRCPLYAFCIVLKKTGLSLLIQLMLKINSSLNFIFNNTYHNANSMIFRLFFKLFEWRVPVRYFESAKNMPAIPPHLLVPQPIDGYLAVRYGGDWRVPKSKWFYMVDDGCIYPGESVSYSEVKKIHELSRRT